MKLPQNGSHQSSLAEINIIPLVDIMLVLLIIFMVTAPLLQQGINVDLPDVNASSSVAASDKDIVLSIDKDGRLFLGNESKTPYSLQNIGDKLAAIYKNKEKKDLYLQADKGVKYGYVVQVMALSQKAGIERIGMVTSPQEEEQKQQTP